MLSYVFSKKKKREKGLVSCLLIAGTKETFFSFFLLGFFFLLCCRWESVCKRVWVFVFWERRRRRMRRVEEWRDAVVGKREREFASPRVLRCKCWVLWCQHLFCCVGDDGPSFFWAFLHNFVFFFCLFLIYIFFPSYGLISFMDLALTWNTCQIYCTKKDFF